MDVGRTLHLWMWVLGLDNASSPFLLCCVLQLISGVSWKDSRYPTVHTLSLALRDPALHSAGS